MASIQAGGISPTNGFSFSLTAGFFFLFSRNHPILPNRNGSFSPFFAILAFVHETDLFGLPGLNIYRPKYFRVNCKNVSMVKPNCGFVLNFWKVFGTVPLRNFGLKFRLWVAVFDKGILVILLWTRAKAATHSFSLRRCLHFQKVRNKTYNLAKPRGNFLQFTTTSVPY